MIFFVGYYCPAGANQTIPCPPGTYNPTVGIRSVDECLGCPPGQFCKDYGMNATSGNCSDGYYCTMNSSSSQPPG